jgi:hypothetical protein
MEPFIGPKPKALSIVHFPNNFHIDIKFGRKLFIDIQLAIFLKRVSKHYDSCLLE